MMEHLKSKDFFSHFFFFIPDCRWLELLVESSVTFFLKTIKSLSMCSQVWPRTSQGQFSWAHHCSYGDVFGVSVCLLSVCLLTKLTLECAQGSFLKNNTLFPQYANPLRGRISNSNYNSNQVWSHFGINFFPTKIILQLAYFKH